MSMWKINSKKSIRYTIVDDCESVLSEASDQQQESDTQEEESGGEYISINGLEGFLYDADEIDSMASDEERNQESITKEESGGEHPINNTGSDETIASVDADWPDITIYVIMFMVIVMITVILFNFKKAFPKHPNDLTPIILAIIPIIILLLQILVKFLVKYICKKDSNDKFG